MANPFTSLRHTLISRPVLNWYRQVLPPLSATEREALEAGNVWWDGELFSGRPDWKRLRALPRPRLSAEEQAFMDGPVEELCRMLDDWQINIELKDLPKEVWTFIRDQGFLGMIIPKEYGGLGFSALAHSSVVMKLSTRSLCAAVTVMVPNSLGPAELLLRYGTEAQKDYYLPRLASGEELPCFSLTSPEAGSDAASMSDHGVVCYGEFQGRRTLGVRLTWEKRYITLGPVATVMGLAFKLFDPDHLLGEREELGITLALIPTHTPGVNIGRRHYPVRQVFQNGPNSGTNVFIPMDWVIGGRAQVGQGWRMLMECLAAGRSISLPALATGATKFCARTTGAYARVRKQFKVPIGTFEGVQEALTRIAGQAYMLEAARQVTAAAIDSGERSAVLSAIVKYHCTERMRCVANDAMDVHAGKGICDGPRNYLANVYQALPVSITVEGANILTRSLIIFGQGAIRCHPYLLKELQAAQEPDASQALADFDRVLFAHIGFLIGNLGRAVWHNLTAGKLANAPKGGPVTGYYQQLSRTSATFALLTDLTLLILGGELKRKERLSARFGDILSEMYLISCALKRFEDEGGLEEDLPLLHWGCQNGFYNIQQRLDEILANYPSRPLAWLLRLVVFPWGRRHKLPSDLLGRQCAERLLTPSPARDRLTASIFVSKDPDDVTGCLEDALEKVLAAEVVERKLHEIGYRGSLKEAVATGVISEAEAQLIAEAEDATRRVISVDDFAPTELTGEVKRGPSKPQIVAEPV